MIALERKPLLDVDKIVKDITQICKKRGSKCCFVQLPEGLIHLAHKISSEVLKEGIRCVVSVDPCFGACDIPYWKAKILGCDLIVHVGHAPIPTIKVPFNIEFVEIFYDVYSLEIDLERLLNVLRKKDVKNVGLVATVQYIKVMKKVGEYLQKNGIKVHIGKASGRAVYDGQILGCNVSTAMNIRENVDLYVFIGDGLFHPVAIYLATNKPVLAYNPLTCEIKDVKDLGDKLLRVRIMHMIKTSEAQSFGIIVTSKIGQYSRSALESAIKTLKDYKKDYSVIHMENIGESLNYIKDVDAFVIVGCPRLVYDDYAKFKKPVVTVPELILLLEGKFDKWSFMELL